MPRAKLRIIDNRQPDIDGLFERSTHERPRTRSECADVPRPCPFVSCKYNLFINVEIDDEGSTRLELERAKEGKLDPSDCEGETLCALDIADKGGATLEEVGAAYGKDPELIRKEEMAALEKLQGYFEPEDIAALILGGVHA